ncbi:MoaD/ThiS family protein [Pseudoclavibacter chungangensis]|uniref:MoaD/ThiS family protein n=1 Tax=Pseudoclavibacter chungangensis TaxID=587635 RepID=A0A7J5BQ63_9MICO|nr:MoaD/ThiS family protein [Pseudoclavibacter chungangensis]KAB1655651.1 MoaD/ThiS family protein [Pseudoclavibacter chungangensis]NYJ67947.1 molybdopterin converting factor small subunit [Pseudoclavibacter chungangensis]
MILVRLFAAAAEAAGTEEERVDAIDTDAVDAALRARFGTEFARVLDRSTFLVDGVRVERGDNVALAPHATVDVLPPFAGG